MNSFITLFLLSLVYLAKSQQFITVTGQSQVPANPDQALVVANVNLQGQTLSAALGNVDNATASISNYLQNNGVNSSDIQISFASVQQSGPSAAGNGGTTANTSTNTSSNSTNTNSTTNTTVTPPPSNGNVWTVQKAVTFLIGNLNNYENLIQGVFANGATSLASVTFLISNEANLIDQARGAAITDAQQNAAALAGDLGASLGNVTSITDQTAAQPQAPVAIGAAAPGASAPNLAVGGNQAVITGQVLVTWNLV